MEGVLPAFAQFDNDTRSDRTRAGMRAGLELGRSAFLAPLIALAFDELATGIHEAGSHCPNHRGRFAHAAWIYNGNATGCVRS